MNQNQSRILSRRMLRTGLHMRKIDWKARGRGRGLEPVKWALYDSSSSSEATGGPNRSWALAGGIEGPTAQIVRHCNVAFLLLGLALTLGPECDTVRVSGQILMLGPCEWLTPARSLLCSLLCDFPRWLSLHSCYYKPSDQWSALLAAACSTGPGSVVKAVAFHQYCPSQPPAR